MKYSLTVTSNKVCPEVSLVIALDGHDLSIMTADGLDHVMSGEIDEVEATHTLMLVMTGKTPDHTILDSDDQIIDDIFFEITRLEFEDLDMMPIFCLGKACYTHDFNQCQQSFVDEFYGRMGCNGTVLIEFATPFYLWLNDHF